MSACTLPAPQPPFPGRRLLLLLAAAGLGALLLLAIPNDHAVNRHGADAAAVQKCLQQHGPYQVWQDIQQPDRWWQLCRLDDGRWGVQLVARAGDLWHEVTAFIPRGGKLAKVIQWLGRRAIPPAPAAP